MDPKIQRFATIIIGLVLAGLVVYIGIRIVQQRSSQASTPVSFSATRVGNGCKLTLVAPIGEGTFVARTGNLYDTIDSSVTLQDDGTYRYVKQVTVSSGDDVEFSLVNHDLTAICRADSGSAGSTDSQSGYSDVLPTPTLASEFEGNEYEGSNLKTSMDKVGLSAVDVDNCFAEGDCTNLQDCFECFKTGYYGVAQGCASGAQRNATVE